MDPLSNGTSQLKSASLSAIESVCPWWKWSVIFVPWMSSYVRPVLRTCYGVFANGTVRMTAFVVPYKVRMNRYIALIALICFQDFLKIFYYLVLLGCIGKQAISKLDYTMFAILFRLYLCIRSNKH